MGQSAVFISGFVTFIAAYHYFRIFNSWVDAYEYQAGKVTDGAMVLGAPALTGIPFNDAYRYMDWLLTVPLLLIEILLVMKLDEATFNSKAKVLGVGSALMIVSGYYGELVITGDLTPRWICWALSMSFFLYIVKELLVGLAEATNSEADPAVKQDQGGTGDDRDQLVHLSRRVPLPDARNQRGQVCCLYPTGLLRLRHHLQVRCRTYHLPDILCQISEGGASSVKRVTLNGSVHFSSECDQS